MAPRGLHRTLGALTVAQTDALQGAADEGWPIRKAVLGSHHVAKSLKGAFPGLPESNNEPQVSGADRVGNRLLWQGLLLLGNRTEGLLLLGNRTEGLLLLGNRTGLLVRVDAQPVLEGPEGHAGSLHHFVDVHVLARLARVHQPPDKAPECIGVGSAFLVTVHRSRVGDGVISDRLHDCQHRRRLNGWRKGGSTHLGYQPW